MVVMTEQKYLHNCHFQFGEEKTFHKICSIFLFSVGQNHVYVDIINFDFEEAKAKNILSKGFMCLLSREEEQRNRQIFFCKNTSD